MSNLRYIYKKADRIACPIVSLGYGNQFQIVIDKLSCCCLLDWWAIVSQ